MEIREIKEIEMKEALQLVWKVFLEYEAPDYTEEGINEFKRCIEDREWLAGREFFGAFEDGKIIGVIATRKLNHIALFFVDGSHHGKGIGRKLYNEVLERNKDDFFTVNSSPFAKDIYSHFGFEYTSEMQEVNGLKFYPMRNELKKS